MVSLQRPVVARVTSRHIRGVSGSVAQPNEVTVDESGNDDGEEEQDANNGSKSGCSSLGSDSIVEDLQVLSVSVGGLHDLL